jgi:glycosyltransferase involved in cell wall biosynthesis
MNDKPTTKPEIARPEEQKGPRFSIIVPVYNTREYVEKCLYSAVNQTERDIEIIIVDDGSTDGSESICSRFAAKDSRIKFFRKENGGQGLARNYGIMHATGKYILFVDSDDEIDLRLCEIANGAFQKAGADIVSFGLQFETLNGWVTARRSQRKSFISEQPDIFIDAMLDRNFLSSPCNKVYKCSLILENDLKFPISRAYEDSLFSKHVAYHAKRVLYIPDILYRAVMRPGSISRKMSINNFVIAVDLISRERELFSEAIQQPHGMTVFRAHVVRFFAHLLLLSAFRIDDPKARRECLRLTDEAGFSSYASQNDVRKLLSARTRLQILLARRPSLARVAALVAMRLNIIPS